MSHPVFPVSLWKNPTDGESYYAGTGLYVDPEYSARYPPGPYVEKSTTPVIIGLFVIRRDSTAALPVFAYATYGGVACQTRACRIDPANGGYGPNTAVCLLVLTCPITPTTVFADDYFRFSFTGGTYSGAPGFIGCTAQLVDQTAMALSVEVSSNTSSPLSPWSLPIPAISLEANDGLLTLIGTSVADIGALAVTTPLTPIVLKHTAGGGGIGLDVAFKEYTAATDVPVIWTTPVPYTASFQFAFAMSLALKAYSVPTATGYNCSCVDEDTFQPLLTLAALRRRFLVQTGYAAQADNPPASAVTLANELLLSSQTFLYMKYPALRTRRLFRWTMEPGVRFYELNENDEDPTCGFSLNPYKAIEWVGVRDPNGTWLPMVDGIDPTYYTMVDQVGTPAYYEIRQCIEVLPAPPADGYELWIKGHFGLAPFAADTDQTTIDSELVLLFAIANRKAAQGSPDAKNYASMVQSRLGDLTAGTHGRKKYIPGTIVLPPAVMPVFLPTVP